jgi:hypothetical protein
MAAPWPIHLKRAVIRRGPHVSAAHHFRDFLWEDMTDMVGKGFWVVLPFKQVQHYLHLKLAPCGVVPQRTRRPRPIMDYTFTGVNQASAPLAPMHAMQFGSTFQRILQRLAYANPQHGPTYIAKFDLSDGYYRIPLSPEAALELAVVLPPLPNFPQLVGIPLTLPMGWKYSPPYFCAFTETATDLANRTISTSVPLPPHVLEEASQLYRPPMHIKQNNIGRRPEQQHQLPTPLSYVDIYMDDFIALSQPLTTTHTLRACLHSIHSIFRGTPHPEDPPMRKEVISASKLAAGDGHWSTQKNILGWLVDTESASIHLLPHKAARLQQLIQTFLPLHRTSKRKWLALLGELRHMAMAIPGAKHLFSLLQNVLVEQPRSTRLRLSPLLRAALEDWRLLAINLTAYPTPIRSLVPAPPDFVGAVDASGIGLGGFWVAPQPDMPSLAFRYQFPSHIRQQLVTVQNPQGRLTNSDFELAALIMGAATLGSATPLQHAHLWCASDNTPAVAWCQKGSTSSKSSNAFLLRWLAGLTRTLSFVLRPVSVPGATNTVADFCSRAFDLSDQEFVRQLQSRFPTKGGWTLARPQKHHVSAMISALSNTMSPLDNRPPEPLPHTTRGTSGRNTVHPSTCILWPSTSQTQFPYYKSSLCDTGAARYLPVEVRSAVARWEMPFVPLGRRSPTWDNLTRA